MTTFIIAGRAVLNHLEQADGSIKYEPGGSALLQAKFIKENLPDARVILLTDLGNDAQGDEFLRLMNELGIETPPRIDRSVIELTTLYAYWPFGAKTYDKSRCYLDSVPAQHSALTNYQLPKINGPIFFVATSEGTTVEWADRYAHIADQAIELGAAFALLPNSRENDPEKPHIAKLKADNLPLQWMLPDIAQLAAKDFPHMFGDNYSPAAVQRIRSYNPRTWLVVTNGGKPAAIFKPEEVHPDLHISVPEIPGLPKKFDKVNGGTFFGAAMLVALAQRSLNMHVSFNRDPSDLLVLIAESVASGGFTASQLVARNNGLDIACVKQPRLATSLHLTT